MSALALPPMALRLMGDSAALSSSPPGTPGDEQVLAMLAVPSINDDGTLSLPSGVTYSRSSTAMFMDWEGVYQAAQINEPRLQGARRVENLLNHSTDFSNAYWVKYGAGTGSAPAITPNYGSYNGYPTCRLVFNLNGGTTTSDQSTLQNGSISGVSGTVRTTSFWIRTLDGSTVTFRLRVSSTYALITVTPAWRRIGHVNTTFGDNTLLFLSLRGAFTGGYADVEMTMAQTEFSGLLNTAPSDYINVTDAAVAKYYLTTNGNSVASNIVTEAPGVSLHPTRNVYSQPIFDNYPAWTATTVYALGQRIIPATGTGPAGGDGYWYYCSTAGTSGGTEPTFGAGTTADGTAVWTRGGYYRIAGYLHEQAATNLNDQSRNFSNAAWIKVGGSVGSGNVKAVDGTNRTTNTFTASAPNATLLKTITAASAVYVTQIFLKRSVGTGGVDITIDGGLTWVPVTLSSTEWKAFSVSQTVLNPVIGIRVQTTADAVLIDMADLLAGSLPSSPIPTAGSTVAKAADAITLPANAVVDARGTLVADVQHIDWSQAAGQVLGDGTEAVLKLATTVSGAQSDDGTTTISGPTGTPTGVMRQAVRWSGSARQVFVNGVAGTAGAYDGSFNLSSLAIGPSALNALIKNLRLYPLDVSATRLLYLSAKDTA